MIEQKLLHLLGLAYRARKVCLGVPAIIEQVQKRQVYYVIIATDVQKNSKKKLIDKCKTYHVPYIEMSSRQLLGHAVGKRERVAIALLDEGFARKFHSLIEN